MHNIYSRLLWGVLLAWVSVSAQAGLPIQRWTATNQAEVLLIESPALPMVDIQVDFDAGSRRDPAAQAGLASAVAAMMSKGVRAREGVPAMDENALGEAWADLGAMLGASAGGDRFSVTLRTLTVPDVLQGALRLAARQLADPAFASEVWSTERARFIASIKEANSQPGTVAQRTYGRAVYGTHPYGQDADEATLQAIGVADLRQFHERYLHTCRARVSSTR